VRTPSGFRRTGSPATEAVDTRLCSPGGIKWEPITITPEESQFLETRSFQRSEIASWFRVPPHMIGDVERSTSWGTGIEQQGIGFVVYTLRPYLERIEGSLSRLLPGKQFMKFNVDALLRGDIESRYRAHQISLDSGWQNPDGVRALEDLPPDPWRRRPDVPPADELRPARLRPDWPPAAATASARSQPDVAPQPRYFGPGSPAPPVWSGGGPVTTTLHDSERIPRSARRPPPVRPTRGRDARRGRRTRPS
jgi:hypothetical protein